jgi:GNAT superfamily N-acetyltransferase
MPLEVAPVEHGRDLKAFIAFPYRLFRGDALWVPPLRRDVQTRLTPGKSPFFEHASAQHFLARRDGRVVGRISAVENRLHNEFHNDRVGFFGFFDCEDDQDAANALFDAAAAWLGPRGLDVMRGPASLSLNDESGLLVDGFELPPVVMMPHNPPYYVRLVEQAGFAASKNLFAYSRSGTSVPDRLVRATKLMAQRYGITVRPLSLKRFTAEVDLIKTLYNDAWERNWGFVPMTDAEIDHLAKEFRPVVEPELVLFAEREGQPIGFALALPDLNVALKTNPSGRLFPGIVKMLWAARKIHRIRVLLLGAVPEWRGRGVDALLYAEIWRRGNAKGYFWGEAGWVLEDNAAMNNGLLRMGFEVYKTYRLYDRPL